MSLLCYEEVFFTLRPSDLITTLAYGQLLSLLYYIPGYI